MNPRLVGGHPRVRPAAGLTAIAVMILLTGCVPGAGEFATATPRPVGGAQSDSPEPVASPTPDDAPHRPPISTVRQTDAGPLATVLQPRLTVHDFAGNAFDQLAELRAGTEVAIVLGPLTNDGLDWFEIAFGAIAGDPDPWGRVGHGWVAAGPSGQDAEWLRIDSPRCPKIVTANDIGAMSTYARLECLGTGSHEVTGVIRGCTDYWEPPDGPKWLLIECLNLGNQDGTFTDLNLHFPPELDAAEIHDIDIVRLVGHVDDPRASRCRDMVSAEPPIPTGVADAYSVMDCRGRFVVTQVEIIRT